MSLENDVIKLEDLSAELRRDLKKMQELVFAYGNRIITLETKNKKLAGRMRELYMSNRFVGDTDILADEMWEILKDET